MPSWNLEDFVDLALRVRNAQRKYFRTRTQVDLEASRTLEGHVDRAIREVKESRPLIRALPPDRPEPEEERPHR